MYEICTRTHVAGSDDSHTKRWILPGGQSGSLNGRWAMTLRIVECRFQYFPRCLRIFDSVSSLLNYVNIPNVKNIGASVTLPYMKHEIYARKWPTRCRTHLEQRPSAQTYFPSAAWWQQCTVSTLCGPVRVCSTNDAKTTLWRRHHAHDAQIFNKNSSQTKLSRAAPPAPQSHKRPQLDLMCHKYMMASYKHFIVSHYTKKIFKPVTKKCQGTNVIAT